MLMRHAHEYEAKPRGGLAKRIVAVLASVAMLGGMGYATTSAALAEDTPATVETTTDQSVTTANETTGDGNVTNNAGTDNAGDTSADLTGTESDTNTGADAGVNTGMRQMPEMLHLRIRTRRLIPLRSPIRKLSTPSKIALP